MNIGNRKVTLITPEDEEYNQIDGQIISFGKIEKYSFHSFILLEYGKEVYGEDSIFKILEECQMSSVFAFFLTEYYDTVVFLNLCGHCHSKCGLLYLPSDLSDKQKKSINELIKNLKGYQIEVNQDLKLIDGFVESEKVNIKSDGTLELFKEKKKTL